MRIIDLLQEENKEFWLAKISQADWHAAQFLHYLIRENKVYELLGLAKVLMLVEEDKLLSFCTLAEKDDIKNTTLSPWIGFVYTFPQYRGNRYMGLLIDEAIKIAKKNGNKNIYISTNEIGLYEKYGFEFYTILKDLGDKDSRVYIKQI